MCVVLAMATGAGLSQLSFVGLLAMWDPPRAGVGVSIATLRESGVQVKMITGDAKETGEAIGMCWLLGCVTMGMCWLLGCIAMGMC